MFETRAYEMGFSHAAVGAMVRQATMRMYRLIVRVSCNYSGNSKEVLLWQLFTLIKSANALKNCFQIMCLSMI